ncbi:hypothetical protein [Pseudonocardia sp. EC080625-04]|uniref:hypothetical protein n=1 Tax=Pseudonocardia sp. EC080625-04 TaxID=1096868 RepID=UPI000AAB0ACF|nr:hypothetical protein [Pseudonocardia sp. EC080625-04]
MSGYRGPDRDNHSRAGGRTIATATRSWPPEPPRRRGPNVVVVVVDDMGYSDIGPFGSEIPTRTWTGSPRGA